jgi:hypothetical protein
MMNWVAAVSGCGEGWSLFYDDQWGYRGEVGGSGEGGGSVGPFCYQ